MPITKPIILDETGKAIVQKLGEQNSLLGVISRNNARNSWGEIASAVKDGIASSVFNVGDIFYAPYKLGDTTYSIPWHVCGVRNVTLPNGTTKEALVIQMHKMLPKGIQFDNYEAFYKATKKLPAGTYNVTMTDSFGDYIASGDTYSFTLTQPVPQGGVLTGFENLAYLGASGMKIRSYSAIGETVAIEEVVPSKTTEGTHLGDLSISGTAGMNGLQQVCYGYNRYSQSYIRQWLNGSGKNFWKPQHDYDRPPANYKEIDGFMTGFDEEFLSVLGKFKLSTGKNTVYDDGGMDETYDIFALPSLEQMYIKKQVAGEGEALPYWKEALGTAEPRVWYQETPELVELDMNNTPRYVWLRSARVGGAGGAGDSWFVLPSGHVDYNPARHPYCVAPLAVIY